MQILRKYWIIVLGVCIVVVAVAAAAWWWVKVGPNPLPVDPSDSIASWTLPDIYANNPAGEARTTADIAHLTSLMGGKQFTDYELLVGLAQDYEALGQAKTAYDYLIRAVHAGPTGGLAWNNLGELMAQLGALTTAKTAYARAVAVEPTVMTFRLGQLQFLIQYFPQDSSDILPTIKSALALQAIPDIYQDEAQWLASTGSTTGAISAWEQARLLIAPSDRAAIDAEIARLKATQ